MEGVQFIVWQSIGKIAYPVKAMMEKIIVAKSRINKNTKTYGGKFLRFIMNFKETVDLGF